MGILLLSLLSLLLFTLSAHFMIRNLMAPIVAWKARKDFSRRALRIERRYKTFAWALMTFFLFVSMLISFWQSFIEL